MKNSRLLVWAGAGIALLASLWLPQATAQITNVLFSDDFTKNGVDSTKYVVDAPFFEGGKGDIAPKVENGVLEFTGTVSQQWWAGATLRLVQTFPVSPETNIVISVDRVAENGIGTASRSALWIMDETRTKFVLFAENRGEGGWQYNRKLGISGDNPTGGGSNIAAFDGTDTVTEINYDDQGQHRMKAVMNGKDIKLYLDEKFGATVSFPFNMVVLELGSYARANDDTADTIYDNLKIEAIGTATFSINSLTMGNGQTASNLVVRIPPGANTDKAVTIQVKNKRPTVASVPGATVDTLTLTFDKGGPNTKTFDLTALAIGSTQLTLTNTIGLVSGNVLDVTVTKGPSVLLQDDFASASLDSTKWQTNAQPFEPGAGTGVFDLTQAGGTLQISGSVVDQYWPGLSIQSKDDFTASKDLPLVVEVDRVSIDPINIYGYDPSTGVRTGVFLTSYDNNNARTGPWVLFAQDAGETGWEVNIDSSNPTGSGTALAAFADLAADTNKHRMKLSADGSKVEVFLDDVSGGKFDFPATSFIKVEVGAYGRTSDDAVKGVFDNVKVQNVFACMTAAPTDLLAIQGDSGNSIAVTIPKLLSVAGDVKVTITSQDPSIAEPAGAVNGSLTLTFATGQTNVQSFRVAAKKAGATVFDLSNDKGVCVANSVNVSVTTTPVALFSDDFSSGSIDTTKWTVDNTPLVPGGTALPESTVLVTNGMAELSAIAEGADWPGFTLWTTKSFEASATAPVVFEIDRVVMEYELVGGTDSKQKTAIWVKDAAGHYVSFSDFGSYNAVSGGWQYHRLIGKTGDNSATNANSGTYIPEFNAPKYTDQKNHRMRMVVTGTTAKLYLDGVFGTEVPFPFSTGLTFGFGAYVNFGNSGNNTVRGFYDNATVLGFPPAPPSIGPLKAVKDTTGNVVISWTTSGTLQFADAISAPVSWKDVTPAPTGKSYTVTPAPGKQQYFRLIQ
jgi:hypothetical protein